jgi:hypothetical protein
MGEGESKASEQSELATRRMWAVGTAPRPLYREKDIVPVVQETALASGPVWAGTGNLAHAWIPCPDRPARSTSLSWSCRSDVPTQYYVHSNYNAMFIAFYTRSVRKVSSHFEYLENRSRGLDVCNLAANHRRPYCASVKRRFPVGLVSRQ